MTTGLGISTYIDVPTFLRAPANQETASLLGMNTTLGSSQPAGTTNLQVASSTNWSAGLAWILDGPTSEVVTITGSADGTHVTLAAPGTAFAHGAGVSISQAGSKGSLDPFRPLLAFFSVNGGGPAACTFIYRSRCTAGASSLEKSELSSLAC